MSQPSAEVIKNQFRPVASVATMILKGTILRKKKMPGLSIYFIKDDQNAS